ncbi:methylmalonyl-CoA mutase family protein [uncultured Formosa sp.]|uniref:methylmalonyl-CoA mutase family protein n=1 Tax=uncultured Formosa sp. TaxID=255435 RepID=UPI00261F9821|nr:methylmalonyl-CoA mutase family protein [uncultured Formosa sp.]
MSRKNLQHITLKFTEAPALDNQNKVGCASGDITVESTYTETDLEDVHHLDFAAGIPPYLRGISSTMYVTSPWDMCQYSPLNSIETFNSFLKYQFEVGQREFLINCSTKNKFIPETLEDFKAIFKDIPLQDISVFFNTNEYLLPLLACYTTTAESHGLESKKLKGGFIIDVFSDLKTLKTTKNSRLDALIFSNTYLPYFNRISISAVSLQSQVITPEIELALMLISGNNQIQKAMDSGLKIDDIAPRISFTFSIGLHHFSEIAKLRAVRLLWAKIVKSYHPKNDRSLALHIHSHTYTNQSSDHDISHSVTKSTIAAASAIFGGSQSLDTYSNKNSTPELKQLNNHTQWYLREETQITKTIDPWGGSFYVEKRTHDIAQQAWSIFKDYKTSGKLPERLITELSQYELDFSKTETSVQNSNISTINRDESAVKHALLKLTDARHSLDENVLTLAINAFKNQATYSEIYKAIN